MAEIAVEVAVCRPKKYATRGGLDDFISRLEVLPTDARELR